MVSDSARQTLVILSSDLGYQGLSSLCLAFLLNFDGRPQKIITHDADQITVLCVPEVYLRATESGLQVQAELLWLPLHLH